MITVRFDFKYSGFKAFTILRDGVPFFVLTDLYIRASAIFDVINQHKYVVTLDESEYILKKIHNTL